MANSNVTNVKNSTLQKEVLYLRENHVAYTFNEVITMSVVAGFLEKLK